LLALLIVTYVLYSPIPTGISPPFTPAYHRPHPFKHICNIVKNPPPPSPKYFIALSTWRQASVVSGCVYMCEVCALMGLRANTWTRQCKKKSVYILLNAYQSPYEEQCLPMWLNVSPTGPMSPYMAQCLPIRSNESLSGPMSPFLAQCPLFWPNVSLSGSMTPYLAQCLPIWPNVSPYGPMSSYQEK
jgi:hypothetical protein